MSKFAVGFEKSEHVVEPDARPAVGKAMPLVGRATVRRVDSNLRRFVRRLHRGVQSSAWRKAVVVLSLEKEDRRLRVLDRVQPELPMAAIRMASTKGCSLSQANAAVYGTGFRADGARGYVCLGPGRGSLSRSGTTVAPAIDGNISPIAGDPSMSSNVSCVENRTPAWNRLLVAGNADADPPRRRRVAFLWAVARTSGSSRGSAKGDSKWA